ncbi:MAG: copper chaperone [Deltaproteobacteria bacterium]|nr:copper chaperone [Deltaproteobacteria bacterium]TLN01791.1 MAG: heavy-metal-associated domain-containing protein [bacterium]
MNIKKLSTSLLVIAAITVLVVFALRVGSGITADSVAVLQTKGMTCGSCSSKISKALESLSGVAITEVDANGGWVIVGYDTKTVKPDALAKKVTGAGFASKVYVILTPEQFKQISGREIGANAAQLSGCCGGNGGCGTKKQS